MPSLGFAVRALGAYGALNGYWGQNGIENLRTYCDSGIDYVTLSFVNQAPEHNETNYPGTNFAAHCWATTYEVDGNPSNLLSHCQDMKNDIPYCRSKGVKVLLSIGGRYNEETSNYLVSTEANGNYFANFLYNAFGPYNSSWTGPRPFDIDANNHTQVDGFDFDIEMPFDMKPYIAMADTFRRLGPSLILTAAPQCPSANPDLKDLISKASLDALFVQFYNNPVCDAISGNMAGESFNYDYWVSTLASSSKSKNAKIFIGLPTYDNVQGETGYISPQALKDLVCKWRGSKNFGGVSLWDLTLGAAKVVNGKTYNQHAKDALAGGCPTTTATSTTTTTKPTTTSKPGNGITTPLPTQPTIASDCNKFYKVPAKEGCETAAKKNGLSLYRFTLWNPSVGSTCNGLWADAYACISVIGYTPYPTTTCGSTGKSWGDNKADALARAKRWCSGNGGSLTYNTAQTKTGCYNALLGTNKYQFSIRNDYGISVSMPVEKCERIMTEVINCGKGGTGLLESWWFKAEVVSGQC
jgi:chitinase